MFGYALRHPRTKASNDIVNEQGLTPLTLACRLGRSDVFKEMLELSCREFWRYSNITCSAYPLNALDTILPDGQTSWFIEKVPRNHKNKNKKMFKIIPFNLQTGTQPYL